MHRRLHDRTNLIHNFVSPLRPLPGGLNHLVHFIQLLVGPLREVRYVSHHRMAVCCERFKFFLQFPNGVHQLLQLAPQMEGDGDDAKRQDNEGERSNEKGYL